MRYLHRLRELLGSKVARRMIALFVACALGPMVVLALVSYVQVSRQLYRASEDRRHQAGKSVGMDLMALIRRMESDLTLAASQIQVTSGGRVLIPPVARDRLQPRFRNIVLEWRGRVLPVLSTSVLTAGTGISAAERGHLAAGRAALRAVDDTLVMIKPMPRDEGILIAELSPDFMWGMGDLAPPTMDLLVLGPDGQTILPPAGEDRPSVPGAVVEGAKGGGIGEVEWAADDDRRMGTYWTIPMGFDFLLPRLTVFVSEPRSVALEAIDRGRRSFVLIAASSLLLVLLLALIQVKRSLVPLDQLEAGTRRLGEGDFDKPVVVTSGDEFEGLAHAFNSMSGQLKRQFRAMSARAALDRAVLSSLDESTILTTALERLPDLVGCEYACLATFATVTGEVALAAVSIRTDGRPQVLPVAGVSLSGEDAAALRGASSLTLTRSTGLPSYASPLAGTGWARGMAFPMLTDGRLIGVLTVASAFDDALAPDEELQLRRLADQIAVALSNARLLGALDRLNVGTLQALARTVDAKSPWTAGHSQRVASMATDLGRALALGSDTLDILTRGALLHDIGKIAVPTAILNKPAALTADEYAVMKGHPRAGARILEPIPEYGGLIPIVLQHHEWFDGRGYPDGLSGDAISFEARIVAVADVFDAVTSKRPYRDSLGLERSIEIIRNGSGTQFDPAVVDAFLSMIAGRTTIERHFAA